MTSAHKRQTNRVNARASTGPKTVAGRKRSAQNARRHGLALPVLSDPSLQRDVEALAQAISGKGDSTQLCELARQIAAAQIDLLRVRRVRRDLIARAFSDPQSTLPMRLREQLHDEEGTGPGFKPEARIFRPDPSEPAGLVTVLSALSAQLISLDRYERRALSRRKFAVRDFDAVAMPSARHFGQTKPPI